MKWAAYMRVSKKVGMTVENQRPTLERWFESQKIDKNDIDWFIEEESTRKTREVQKEVYEKACNGIYAGVVCVRLDRWGRTTKEICDTVLTMVTNYDRRVVFVNNCLDISNETINAMSKLQLNMMAAFAEFERELIRERTLEGLERAKAEGRFGGRPTGSKDKRPRARNGYFVGWHRRKLKEKEAKKAAKINKS